MFGSSVLPSHLAKEIRVGDAAVRALASTVSEAVPTLVIENSVV